MFISPKDLTFRQKKIIIKCRLYHRKSFYGVLAKFHAKLEGNSLFNRTLKHFAVCTRDENVFDEKTHFPNSLRQLTTAASYC